MMRIPKIFHLLFAVVLLAGMLPLTTAAAQPAGQIEKALLDQLNAEGTANFFVKMAVDADTSAANGMEWNARGQYVWDTLNQVAKVTQAPVIAYCQKHGLDCSPMLINNSVFVRGGSLDAANGLAALPGVAYLRLERIYQLPDPTVGGAGVNGFVTAGASPAATTDWGIIDTKADQAWMLGARGAGMKVANVDTGVQWDHPALVNQFACPGDPSNPACWADPSNICGGSACDNAGHGTHTMGTMVGKDDPSLTYIVGMAPDATWIACKGCESSSCSEFALTTCADWIVAPNGDPANRPNVVNNSWGGGAGDPWYLSYVNNWRNAGIFPAFSAGNSGPSCGTANTPGDYQESFSSAAHDSSRNIASFSSRGPSAFGHDPYTKPNISAPGVSICSSVPTNGWNCGYSGTSMASPHTAGAVAQLWSCAPGLVGQMDATFLALQGSTDVAPAGNCGAPPDGQGNYTFGYGYLDVLNLVAANCGGAELGTLAGHVYDQAMNPVEGATVTAQPAAEGNGINATTDPNGFYTMDLVASTYDVTASKVNYASQTVTGVVVLAGQTTTTNFAITFMGAWTLLPLGLNCPDWTRLDAKYSAATGKAYILGGRGGASGGDTFGDIFAYDPLTNACTDTGANMPVPISNYSIVPVNDGSADLLCTFGGRDSAGGYTTAVQCYNPVANTATQVSTLPGELGLFIPGGEAAVNNIAYVFSGFKNTSTPYHTTQTWAWDPVANTWTQKGDVGIGRGYIQTAVVDGKIYGFGGDVFDGTNLVAQTIAEVFDPATGTWNDAAVADLPLAGGEGRAFGFDSGSPYELAGQIIVAGGGQWPADTNAVYSYNVASDTYSDAFPDLNVSRRNQAGFFVPGDPGRMVVYGGRSSSPGYGGDLPPYAPPEYYPVAQAGPGEPNIVVTPTSLSAEQCPDTVTTQTLQICNTGTAPLDWSMSEVPMARSLANRTSSREVSRTVELKLGGAGGGSVDTNPPVVNAPVSLVLDDGSRDNDIGIGGTWEFLWVNRFTPSPTDFPFNLTQVQVYFSSLGMVNVGDQMVLAVYENTSGNVDPAVGSNLLGTFDVTVQAVDAWNVYDLPVPVALNGPGDVAIGVIAMTVPGSGYWPASIDQTASQQRSWAGWYLSSPPPNPPLLPPDDTWGMIDSFGFPGNWMVRGYGETGGAPDIPWLSEDPTSGTVLPGECTDVTVTFDSTGLPLGDYFGALDIASNDPDTPQVRVPVALSVVECAVEPDIVVTPASLLAQQCPDTITTQTLQICNVGNGELTWTLSEQTPKGPQAILWDNGPLVTHPGGGFGGGDASALQSALGLTIYGFGDQFSVGNRMADDFVIADPGGWNIQQITFFGYQTGAPANPSPLTGVYYQIWDGPPNDPGSSVVFGDLVSNRLASSTFTNIYRVLDTGLLNTDRKVFTEVANAGVVLPPGTYWLDWMTDGSAAYSGPWAPPITILGQTTTGNGMQWTGAWAAALDGTYQQGLPFVIEGETGGPPPDLPWLSENPTSGTVPAGECADVTVTFDSTGLAAGDYFGSLAVASNDPDEPVVTVPVQLTVVACGANELHINRTKIFQHPSAPMVVKVVTQFEIFDQNGMPVPGAMMAGEWTLPDASVVPGVPFYGLTDAKGHEKFRLQDTQSGDYQFCVTAITAPGFQPWPVGGYPGDPDPCLSIIVP